MGVHADSSKDTHIFYSFESFVIPSKTYRLNLKNFNSEFVREVKIRGHYGSSDDYVTDQVWYSSADGTEVPMFVTRRKETLKSVHSGAKKPAVTLLTAYGGFGVST